MKIQIALLLTVFLTLTSFCLGEVQKDVQELEFGNEQVAAEMKELDRNIGKKWADLQEWQKNSSWLNEQANLQVSGLVYEKGLIGTSVSRNIIPDRAEGWLVVDTVNVSAGFLQQFANLATNFFLQSAFPYASLGATVDRTFFNVRKADTYKEALLADVFEFKKLPDSIEKFDNMDDGELTVTKTSGGFYVRAGAGLFDLLDIEVDEGVFLGPKSKFFVKDSLNITMSKESDSSLILAVERSDESGSGAGFQFGFSFNDKLDIPVQIGINGSDGFMPLKFNYKRSTEKVATIIYRIDTKNAKGKEAFASLLKNDFSLIDSLADEEQGVVREMKKEGEIEKQEWNGGLNLLFVRKGFRNIYINAEYNTLFDNNDRYKYQEVSTQLVREQSSFYDSQVGDEKFSALVPLDEAGKPLGSFVLDISTQYTDENVSGRELQSALDYIRQSASQLKIEYPVDINQTYGQVHIGVRVRFTTEGVRRFADSSEKQMWYAVASASGLSDPFLWETKSKRHKYRQKYLLVPQQKSTPPKEKPDSELKQAEAVVSQILQIQKTKDTMKKANLLVKYLKDGRHTKLLQRTLSELAQKDQVLINGYIRGKKI